MPRLIAAKADMDQVLFVNVHTETTAEGQVVLPLDLEALAELVTTHKAALVVLDAATSVMDGRLDGDRDRQMRQALEPINSMADRTGAAALGIVHFGKRESERPSGAGGQTGGPLVLRAEHAVATTYAWGGKPTAPDPGALQAVTRSMSTEPAEAQPAVWAA